MSGPVENQICKFPFIQKFKNHSAEYKTCVSNPAPKHPECAKLQRAMNWTKQLPEGMHKILIIKNISQVFTLFLTAQMTLLFPIRIRVKSF